MTVNYYNSEFMRAGTVTGTGQSAAHTVATASVDDKVGYVDILGELLGPSIASKEINISLPEWFLQTENMRLILIPRN